MTTGDTPMLAGTRHRPRRAFLGSLIRAGCTVLAAGMAAACEANGHPDAVPVPNSTRPGSSPIDYRPNDGSGLWADFSNTGYRHDPGYTGTGGNCIHGYPGLNDYNSSMSASSLLYVDEPTWTVFNQMHFLGLTIMLGHGHGDKWTFNGCVFDAGAGSDMITQTYLPTAYRQNYCTFKPSSVSSPPGNNGTFTSSPTPPGTLCADSYATFGTNANGAQSGLAAVYRYRCDVWGNAGMGDVFCGSPGNRVVLDSCYIHDQADTDDSGGCGYHQDGVGPTLSTYQQYTDILGCTVGSLGNTNGLAFQTGCVRECRIVGNYFCGWGYTLNLGSTQDYNVAFTDNIYSAELAPIYGPLYFKWPWDSSRGMYWRRNRWQCRPGDQWTGITTPHNGQYWWPSDRNAHATDYGG